MIKHHGNKYISIIILLFLAFLCLFPFYVMIISSSHSTQFLKTTMPLVPGKELYNNFFRLSALFDIKRALFNSFIISAIYSVMTVFLSAFCGYMFSKKQFRMRELLYAVVLIALFFPDNLAIIGFYRLFSSMHLIDTYVPLLLPNILNASLLILSRRYCDIYIKNSVIDSAKIDGASSFMIFAKIIIPELVPMISCMGTLAFIEKWNEFIIPSIIIFSPNKRTMPMIIASTRMFIEIDYGAKYTAILIATVPIIVLFLLSARRIVDLYNESADIW